MVSFCSAIWYKGKASTDLLFWKYRLWVDFKIESVFFLLFQKQTKQKNKFLYIYSYEEIGRATVDSH